MYLIIFTPNPLRFTTTSLPPKLDVVILNETIHSSCSAPVLLSVRPPTGAWLIYQEQHPKEN